MYIYIKKGFALILLALITLLTFNYLDVIEFDIVLKESFSFATIVIATISSSFVIMDKQPKAVKIVSVVILISLFLGGLLFINNGKLNIFIALFILATVLDSILDLIYK